jgi:hypothetical protein
MKVLKGLLTFFLVLIIIGGIGFLGFSIIKGQGNMLGMNMPSTTNNTTGSQTTQQKSTDSSMSSMPSNNNNLSLNTMTIQNKDRLNQVVTMISDAMNQITIDPYSRLTVPGTVVTPNASTAQQGNTTVNIYPNSSTALNVPPLTTVTPQTPVATVSPGANIVYNQAKLEQLHSGIFKLAQGMMLLNDLNDDLTLQATATEPNSYEGYVERYAILLQNKLKLSKSLIMINEGSTLINVNPYASGIGYEYNSQQMEQFHKGVYKLAQGMLQGIKLGDDFTSQMAKINSLSNNNSMNGMNMPSSSGFPTLNVKTVTTIIIIVLILTFILSILGLIKSIFTSLTSDKTLV